MSEQNPYENHTDKTGLGRDLDIPMPEDGELEELSEAEHQELAGIEEDRQGEEIETASDRPETGPTEPEKKRKKNKKPRRKETILSEWEAPPEVLNADGSSVRGGSDGEKSDAKTPVRKERGQDVSGLAGEESDQSVKNLSREEEKVQRKLTHDISAASTLPEDLSQSGKRIVSSMSSDMAMGSDDSTVQFVEKEEEIRAIAGNVHVFTEIYAMEKSAELRAHHDRIVADVVSKIDQAIAKGDLLASDLISPSGHFSEKLQNMGYSVADVSSMLRYRKRAEEMLSARDVLSSFYKKESDSGREIVFGNSRKDTEKAIQTLRSDRFFVMTKSGSVTRNMMHAYFANHADPMLRRMNPAALRPAEIKKILQNPAKYHLSGQDLDMLRLLLKIRVSEKAKAGGFAARAARGTVRKGRYVTGVTWRLVNHTDDVSTDGLKKTTLGVRAAKTAGDVVVANLKLNHWVIGKIPPLARMRTKLKVKVRTGAKTVLTAPAKAARMAARTVRETKPAKLRAGKPFSIAGRSPVVRSVKSDTDMVRTAKRTVRTVTTSFRTGKFVKNAKAFQKGFRKGTDIILLPGRIMGKILAVIGKVFHIVGIVIGIVCLVVIVVFLLMIAVTSAVLSSGEMAGNTIQYAVTDEEIGEHIGQLNEKGLEKYQEAFDIALSAPKHEDAHLDDEGLFPDEAHGGVTLYHYGHPKTKDAEDARIYHNDIAGSKTTNGYHIYYLDSAGNTVGQQTSNTKDVICLASVMLQNDYDDAIVTEGLGIRLMEDWFDLLNPDPVYQVSPLYDAEGSDLFPFSGKTYEGETWYCNHDSPFWSAYDEAVSARVTFYEEPEKPAHEGGCTFDEAAYQSALAAYNEAASGESETDAAESESGSPASAPDPEEYYFCPGHPALPVSYGYRDVNIYVTVLSKEDVYGAAQSGVIRYLVPSNYECTEWEEKEVTLDFSPDYDRYIANFKNDGGWESTANRDWCNDLYNQDWYDFYGVDPYGMDGVTLDSGMGTLSQDQIDEMIASIGDVSAARQGILDFAMQSVGKIPYYWGGKPKAPDYGTNNFGAPCSPDYKGRSRVGLDCSGFVSWVYWSVMGLRPPGMSTGTFCSSLGLQRISANQLKPGDIGLEEVPGARSNHIGIFAGYNDAGQPLWIHCSGS